MLKKVLIVEDSALQAKMYRPIFAGYAGCKLVTAGNGLEAMDKLSLEGDVELILLDINMPKMNGLAFLEEREKGGFGHIPTIVISTEGKDEDIMKALKLGADAYVKKPWKPEQIRELVEKLVGRD